MPSATYKSTFTLDAFDQQEPYDVEAGVPFAKAHIQKTFSGDLEGTSVVDMLSSRTDGGAGYVALERLRVTVDGRTGTFALLHCGTMTSPTDTWATWPIVPGSGTGALAGITGEGHIDIVDGVHHFTLTATLPSRG